MEIFQDYTRINRKNCKDNIIDGQKLKKNLLDKSTSPFINDKTKRFGYPIMNNDPICFRDSPENNNIYTKYFFKNLIDMDNEQLLNNRFRKSRPEVEVNFTNINDPKIIIDLHYNKRLSEERKFLERKSKPYSNNILVIFIDSVSRVNGLRHLKKTSKFFEQFMSYKGASNEKYPSENYHSFQFFKYHSFNGFTSTNYLYMFFGERARDRDKVSITKYLKENGFVTSGTRDWCEKDNIRTYYHYKEEDIYDHLFSLCDPNNEFYSLNTMRCLYKKQNLEYLVEYTDQFWRKYKDNRKYSLIISNHGHEGTLTVIKYIDDILFNFLNDLYNDNLLKDTTVFLLSDHGSGMPSIYFTLDFFQIEINLPLLFILVNDRKNVNYKEQYQYIYKNQQNFITAYDIYSTFCNIIYGNYQKPTRFRNPFKRIQTCSTRYGTSLFNKINNINERCPRRYARYSESGMSHISCK